MTKDLTHYNELWQQARAATYDRNAEVAEQFVPKMYDELINQGYKPYPARRKIEKDCVVMWRIETIDKWIPDEAKDKGKQEAAKASVEARKTKSLTEPKIKIFVTQGQVLQISTASHLSTDGSIWIHANAMRDFLEAVPDKPKSEAPEPLTVQPVSSAPIKAK